MNEEALIYLKDTARDTRELLLHIREVVKYMKDAETEVPEKMRRFLMFFHDIHDLRDLYHQGGQEPPVYIRREIEKCDDRLRHLLEDAYKEGGHFEKIRQEMSMRSGNRYDHTVLITKPTENANETGNGKEDDGAQGSLEGI